MKKPTKREPAESYAEAHAEAYALAAYALVESMAHMLMIRGAIEREDFLLAMGATIMNLQINNGPANAMAANFLRERFKDVVTPPPPTHSTPLN